MFEKFSKKFATKNFETTAEKGVRSVFSGISSRFETTSVSNVHCEAFLGLHEIEDSVASRSNAINYAINMKLSKHRCPQ